jgi:hypothetical protein
MTAAAQFFDNAFADPITVNIAVGWDEIGGSPLVNGNIGEGGPATGSLFTYDQVRTALANDARSGADMTALASLSAADPTNGGSFFLGSAEEKALGLTAGNAAAVDGEVGFQSDPSYPFTFDPNNRAIAGDVDFIGVAEHEIAHAMGRDAYLGLQSNIGDYSILDLYRYSSPGVHDFTLTDRTYFSIDRGITAINSFSTVADPADWAGSTPDAFDLRAPVGQENDVSPGDITEMDILGYDVRMPPPPPLSDFNGDGNSDIPFQNVDGLAAIWLMNGTTPFSEPVVGGNPGSSWQVIGAGDFYGGNQADILWQNTNGQPAIWVMNGTTPVSEPVVGANPGPSWHIVGTGDFNGDGDADILWQNTNGQPAIWLMNGTTPFSEVTVGANPGPSWHIVGTGDFNGDGDADILWQNTDGQAAIWLMNGTTPFSEVLVGANPGPSWQIVGTGNFNGNGDADILWQNTDGQAAIWLMNGTTPFSEVLVGANPGPSWHIVGTGEFSGGSQSDILWQNTNGQASIWLMNGTTPTAEVLVGSNPGPTWHIR